MSSGKQERKEKKKYRMGKGEQTCAVFDRDEAPFCLFSSFFSLPSSPSLLYNNPFLSSTLLSSLPLPVSRFPPFFVLFPGLFCSTCFQLPCLCLHQLPFAPLIYPPFALFSPLAPVLTIYTVPPHALVFVAFD